jgi:pimeloyl-ACP methyl ester carboxylesterase
MQEFREPGEMTEDRLCEITAPVLAVYGASSWNFAMAAHMSKLLPNCRRVTLADHGHNYLVYEPAVAVECIAGFLRDPSGYVAQGNRVSL